LFISQHYYSDEIEKEKREKRKRKKRTKTYTRQKHKKNKKEGKTWTKNFWQKYFSLVQCFINKKLSYCWETVRRESMPRIAEMDVEMTT